MQPNLKSYCATLLEFSTTLFLTDDLISKIRNTSRPDKDGDSAFVNSYKKHRAFVWFKEVDKNIQKFEVEFTYETLSGGKLPKKIPRIEQLTEILSSIKEQLHFNCRVFFSFGKNLRVKPIISLPMKYIEFPNMPYDRIQGLHLVKLDGKEIKYEVILEVPAPGVLFQNVIFKYPSIIDKSLADKILLEAASISERFILKE